MAKAFPKVGITLLQSGTPKKFLKKAQKKTVEVRFFLQSKQEFSPLSAVSSVLSRPKQSE
ncbi:hypothetical protein [Agrobacterium cavarae]|uniref:hypothetical protein n=1 Tax=Agrobacterium cavarae TaxID=2528239 RepID=UPI0028AF0119|nr:hypothetical protein [Agrobacterium cavarae]